MNAIASPAPMTAEEARASAEAWLAQGRPSPGATEHALAVADAGPMVNPCNPTPRPPSCGITSAPVPRDPPGMSHRVPPPPAEQVTVFQADLFSDLARCRVAVERMGRRVVRRERSPAPSVAPLPVVPELIDGADAAARRETIDRVAPLLRSAVELAGLLDTAPEDVARRARAVLARAMMPAR